MEQGLLRKKLKEYMEIISKYQVRTVTFAEHFVVSTPLEYGDIFNYFVKKYSNIIFSAHCHNDLGLATAKYISCNFKWCKANGDFEEMVRERVMLL